MHPGWSDIREALGELTVFYDFPDRLALWLIAIATDLIAPEIYTEGEYQIRQGQLSHYDPKATMKLDVNTWNWTVREGPWLVQPAQKDPPPDADALMMVLMLPSSSEEPQKIQIWKLRS